MAAEAKAQKEAQMNTPENIRSAREAKSAERAQEMHDFHYGRALPSHVMEGWELIRGNRANEEIRVYTRTYDWKHRFWGIKPIGMTMADFWERHDPEVTRHNDAQQESPLDPENPLGPLIGEPMKDLSLPPGHAAKPKKRQKTPEINSTHRVRKPTTNSSKVNKSTQKSLAHSARTSALVEQAREVPVIALANSRPARRKTAVPASGAQQEPATRGVVLTSSTSSTRPGDGSTASTRPVTKDQDKLPSKRPRGRPPAKGKPPKQIKAPAVKGNARVTKGHSSAPSTHKMRTRVEGPAELLQLP